MLLLGISLILLISCISSKILFRFGIPTLLIFIVIGMLLGADGPGNIYFDNAHLAEQISNFALLFIIFFGGFGLNWKKAKSSAPPASLLATIGVVFTAGLIGLFIHFVFGVPILVAMLLASIISPTDAATVFSILNTQKLNLKNRLSYLLEMESGSNDPLGYMLTIIFISLVKSEAINVPLTLFVQLSLGAILGLLIGKLGVWLINKIELEADGLYSILMIGIAIFSYAFTSYVHGNGFLSVYLTGIILGNSKIVHKFSLIKYFDGLSWLMQIILFLTLGLLAFPSQLVDTLGQGIIIALFIFFIARPIAIFVVLAFTKYNVKEKILISWAGFRGAASIVFATYPLAHGISEGNWIFNIVFTVALVSVVFQGTLFIPLAKKLDLVEEEELSLTTFYDESGKISAELLEIEITSESSAKNQLIMNIELPDDVLVVMVNRDGKVVIPRGNLKLLENDKILLAGQKDELFELNESF